MYLINLRESFRRFNLKILITKRVPLKILISFVENTKGYLTEISTYHGFDDRRLIQTIYQNCPKLRYLKLIINNNSILELENLLINCQNLNCLVLFHGDNIHTFNWESSFKILAKLSPDSLFRFKFLKCKFDESILKPFRLFFDDWKNRHSMHPMLLHIFFFFEYSDDEHYLKKNFFCLLEKYKA